MKGLLWKDCLTIRKKYGLPRLVLDLAILAALLVVLEGTGALVVSLLLVPLEVTSMVISLTSFDETWKWDKYAAALPVSQAEIVKSRYAFALLMALVGFVVALAANLIAQAAFGAGRLGTCLLVAVASFFLTLLVLAVLFPSNYRLGVNAGMAVMILFLVAILALWFWARVTEYGWLVWAAAHASLLPWLGCGVVTILFVLSYVLSVSLFRRKFR